MALAPGSIAFTGFNADGNDNISFVVLEEILAGTEIHFSDDEWSGAAFNTGESKFTWTATSTIAAGTIVRIDSIGGTGTMTTNLGTVGFSDGGNRGLSNGGDTVYAYVGTPTAPTTFLAAIASGGFSALNGELTGTGLTLGTHAINLGAIFPSPDIGAYVGARSG